MNVSLTLTVLAALGSVAISQTLNMNKRKIWDETTEYTTRQQVAGNAGYIGQAYPFGAIAGAKTLTYAQYVIQDQDLATSEPWNFGYCGLDPQGSGNPDFVGTTAIVSNITLPTGSGIGAYTVTHTLNTTANAVTLKTNTDRLIFNWQLLRQTNWTTDGIGVHMSEAGVSLPNSTNTPICFQFNSINYHREMNRVEGQVIHPGNKLGLSTANNNTFAEDDRSYRLDLGFDEVTLNGGVDNTAYNGVCPNPNYGYGGLDPDFNDSGQAVTKREDDFAWQVQAGNSYGSAFAFLVSSMAMLPQAVPTPFGDLWLNPTADPLFIGLGVLPFPQQLDVTGTGVFTMKPPAAVRPIIASLPSWSAQALVVNPTTFEAELSTVHTMRPWYDPKLTSQAGWTQAGADNVTPVRIPKPTTFVARWMFFRNDGPGVLEIDEMLNTTKLRTFVVNERTGAREILSLAATEWVVRGKHAKPTSFVYLFNY